MDSCNCEAHSASPQWQAQVANCKRKIHAYLPGCMVTSCKVQLHRPKPQNRPGGSHTGPKVVPWLRQGRFAFSELPPDAGLLICWQLEELSDDCWGDVLPRYHLATARVQIYQNSKLPKETNQQQQNATRQNIESKARRS